MSEIIKARLIPMNDTLANWTSANPIIPQGEFVTEVGVSPIRVKVGDGVTRYVSLPYTYTGGNGDFLGMAITSTVPPVLTGDCYYFTVDTGAFTNLGGVIVPGTSALSIINYDSGSLTWLTSVITNTFSGTPTIQDILNNGSTAQTSGGDTSTMTLLESTGTAEVLLDGDNTIIRIGSVANTGKWIQISGGSVVFYNNNVPIAALNGGLGLIQPYLFLKDKNSVYHSQIQADTFTANRTLSLPNKSGVLAVTSDIVSNPNIDTVLGIGDNSPTHEMSLGVIGTSNAIKISPIGYNLYDSVGDLIMEALESGGRPCIKWTNPLTGNNCNLTFTSPVLSTQTISMPGKSGLIATTADYTLDSVLANGASSNRQISIGTGILNISINQASGGIIVSVSGTQVVQINSNYIQLVRSGNIQNLKPSLTLSGSYDLYTPNKGGTIATTTDFGKGTATLVAGTVAVTDVLCSTTSCVNVDIDTVGGTLGIRFKIVRSAGSFTISSLTAAGVTEVLDTSIVQYTIVY